jgi:3,4-dihydroxy 2-butanone 4-phosphate synthase / GTP cyclohydrolase II
MSTVMEKGAPRTRASSVERAVEHAIDQLGSGRMIIVTDDADREAEGDLMAAAAAITADQVNLMAREARGLICCAVDRGCADRLDLSIQTDGKRGSLHGTAFTQSVDWMRGTTTGISAADRAATLRALADSGTRPEDLARPGHIFPIVARAGGVLERGGHTEAAVDLCRLAGIPPACAICEIMGDDGRMARGNELEGIARHLGLPIISVADIVRFRRMSERLVTPTARAELPTRWGTFTIHHFDSPYGPSKEGPLLLTQNVTLGAPSPSDASGPDEPLLVRVHSECMTGEVFGSQRCDCGDQLAESLRRIDAEGQGAVIYLRQEGRGIGLAAKLQAYDLQDQGLDTVEANVRLGFPPDMRDYWEAAQILRLIGRTRVRMLTNNPDKVAGLTAYGIRVTEQIPLRVGENRHNLRYIQAKRDLLGHSL